MADIKISELTTASEIKNEDNIELSQNTGNGLVSLKATILALATKIVTAINFTSALDTTNKTITGAINEVAQGGGGGTDVIAEDFDSTATYAVGDYCIYEGSLYKCTTAVTTAGDWDSSDWTETLVMDEVEQGGGGGGAGHTIKDDGGNALTQRSNLQFKGVYSHDDSTNSASVVEVARSMTWAEYQLLSAAEKKGLITITDRYTADAMFVNGVFIDTDNVIQASTSYSTSDPLSYTATQDCFVKLAMIVNSGATEKNTYAYIDGVQLYRLFNSDSANGTLILHTLIPLRKGQTLTATTGRDDGAADYIVYGVQAGTNPSIPDYSTTEHKTGRKWIDGSDIYEITVDLGSNTDVSNSTWQSSGITITNLNLILDCWGVNSNGSLYDFIAYHTSGAISIQSGRNGNNTPANVKYITIQYTKSS